MHGPRQATNSIAHAVVHRPVAAATLPRMSDIAPGISAAAAPAADGLNQAVKTVATTQAAVKRKGRRFYTKTRALVKSRPRLSAGVAGSLAVLVIGGYITYINFPNINLRVAASKAGFAAQMPRYTPSGYVFEGPTDSKAGLITVRFSSKKDTGFVTVTQRKTNWDSSTLLENYLNPRTDQYTTFQENGLIIYIFNGSNATWVNQGIWYTIEGNNHLNPEQVIKMAASI